MANESPRNSQPIIEIVAGPNGSGKTTFAESFLVRTRKESVYLNPDLIASGFGPHGSEQASFQAGRILIQDVKDRIARGENLAFESTLSGKTWIALLKEAKNLGYRVRIYFLYLKSVQKNLERIKKRVSLGGHNIPSSTVRRRHPRCFVNFWELYRPLADDWHIFDNSGKQAKAILSREGFEALDSVEQENFVTSFQRGKFK